MAVGLAALFAFASIALALASNAPAAAAQQPCDISDLPGPDETAVVVDPINAVDGTVSLRELGLSGGLVGGCVVFRDLSLPRDPMLVSIEIVAEGFRPTTWANYLVLSGGTQPRFTPELEPGSEPLVIDPCPGLLAAPDERPSAAQELHRDLCAELAATPAPDLSLPPTGTGAGTAPPVASLLLSAAALAAAGLALVLRRA